MRQFSYSQIEQQLVDALPELRPAADFYWKTEGQPGQDCGPYIFFEDLFARYVEVLLALVPSLKRDELLRRAFGVVDEMLGCADGDVQTLAIVGLFEGRTAWWFKRAASFVGPRAAAWLDRHEPSWRNCDVADDRTLPEILDGYHVRAVIARELGTDTPVDGVPGTTYASGGLADISTHVISKHPGDASDL